MCFTTAFGQADSYIDHSIKLSIEDNNGTARYRALSGAFGALGGDLSAIYDNPAGASIYNNNALTGSLNFDNIETKSNYYGNQVQTANNHIRIGQFGGVLSFDDYLENSDWSNFALAFNYHINADFNHRYSVLGSNNEGFTNFNVNPLDDGDVLTFYNTPIEQEFRNRINGYSSVVGFTFAGTYKEKLHLGVSLNGHSSEFNQQTTTIEINESDSGSRLRADLYQDLSVTNNGFSISLGAIGQLTDFLRLGVAYQSPIWYFESLETSNLYDEDLPNVFGTVYIQSEDFPGSYTNKEFDDLIDLVYRLKTPAKWTFSSAVIIGKNGLISADLNLKDFQRIHLSGDVDFSNENIEIDNTLKNTAIRLEIGSEWRVGPVSLRGGYVFEESPYADAYDIENMTGYSLGLGFRYKNTLFDISFDRSSAVQYVDFNPNFEDKMASIDMDQGKFTASLTFNF